MTENELDGALLMDGMRKPHLKLGIWRNQSRAHH